MKKKKIKNLSLKKNTISNFKSIKLSGGGTPTNSCLPFHCLVEDCREDGDGYETNLTCFQTCAMGCVAFTQNGCNNDH